MCPGEFRLQADGLFEFAARLFELAALKVDASQRIVRLRRARIGVECRKQLLLSFAPILSHGEEDAQIVVCRIVCGINRQEVLQSRARLCVVFLLKIDISHQFFGARVPRLKGQGRLQFFGGFIGLAQPEVTHT